MNNILIRVLTIIPAILGLSLIVFLLLELAPGDPTLLIVGDIYTQDVYDRARERLGLDRPIYERYFLFLKSALTGDLGDSLVYRRPVVDLILERLPRTLLLSAGALVVAYAVGLTTGVIAAVKRGGILDIALMSLATFSLAVPNFWLGILLIILFSVQLGWVPAGGFDSWQGLILPIITLGLSESASVARLVRSSMLNTLRSDYVRTAQAKGLRNMQVIINHALRNALLPVVSILGIQLGFFLTGSVVIETVFQWPGIGKLLVDSILGKDFPVTQAILLLIGTMIALFSLVADMTYRLADPRVTKK